MTDNDVLTQEDAGDEMLLMGLRLREGFDVQRFETEFGRPLDPVRLGDLVELGMIEKMENDRIRATPQGWLVLDAVIADLAA